MAIPVPAAGDPALAPPDYRLAFQLAPVGLILSRQRHIVDCNDRVCDIFGAEPAQLIGQSFRILYPSADEYERFGARIAPILNRDGLYADNRVMQRVGGPQAGEAFWCHVTGRALGRRAPHEAGIWSFEDLSARRPVRAELTPREREVLQLMAEGRTNAGIAEALVVSLGAVEKHVTSIFSKLDLPASSEDHRRVLAVLRFLQA